MKQRILVAVVIIIAVSFVAVVILSRPQQKTSVDDVLGNIDVLKNTSVEITGRVQKVNCYSTTNVCTISNKCCNEVSCVLAMKGNSGFIFLLNDSVQMECRGTNCEVECDIVPGNYTLSGIITNVNGETFMDVEQIL